MLWDAVMVYRKQIWYPAGFYAYFVRMICKIFDEKHFVHRCAMVILILSESTNFQGIFLPIKEIE